MSATLRCSEQGKVRACLGVVAKAMYEAVEFWVSRAAGMAAFTGALALLLSVMTGCSSAKTASGAQTGSGQVHVVGSTPTCGVPAEGERVVVLVSGTAHEPAPSLPPRAEQLLRSAANSDASDGHGAKGAVAMVASTDVQAREVLPLTPRRANCAVEHGLQRENLINENIVRIRGAVSARGASHPGLDLLAGIDEAVRGLPPSTLIIVSNGMSTQGGFDLRQVGWHEDPAHLVEQLNQRKLLQDLLPGWRVLFTGLGETAGVQPPLAKPARDSLVSYWRAVCTAAATAGTCEIDETALPPLPPAGRAEMPVIPVEGVSSATGPDGRVTDTLSGAVLFTGDSAALSSSARVVLRSIATRIAAKLGVESTLTVTIRGFVADPPDSTAEGRLATSSARALAVSEFISQDLAARGLVAHIVAVGVGTRPGMTAVVNGVFNEAIASEMRMVTVTY